MAAAATPSPPAVQRRRLRALAHPLTPVVRLGQKGLTPGVLAEVDRSLTAHELLKVRLAGSRETEAEQASELARALGCAVIGRVGHVAILYRPHPDPDRRRYE